MKDYIIHYSKWLFLALLIVNGLTGDAVLAEESKIGFFAYMLGASLAPFIFSGIILLVRRLFGVAWRVKFFSIWHWV